MYGLGAGTTGPNMYHQSCTYGRGLRATRLHRGIYIKGAKPRRVPGASNLI